VFVLGGPVLGGSVLRGFCLTTSKEGGFVLVKLGVLF